MQDIKIDLVYLWVNGQDKDWINEKNKWVKKLNIDNNFSQNHSCRFIDNEELKYSLRSAEMYASWINQIFIITNGQIPLWLDINHPKIKIVKHTDIMPKSALPTFNSQAIVASIDNIEGLSEYFLLANDDTFFSKKVSINDFFDKNGNPYVNLRPHIYKMGSDFNNTYTQSILYSIKLIKERYMINENYDNLVPCHCIDAYRKSYFKECKQVFQSEYNKTIHAKFRADNTVQSMLLKLYMITQKKCKLQLNPKFDEQEKLEYVDNLYVSLESYDKIRKIILEKSPKLLCINDCSLSKNSDRKKLKILLQELFPQKQAWEKIQNFQIKPIFKNNFISLVFAFNEDYCKYFSAALQSIIEHSNLSAQYDIVVLTSEINCTYEKLLRKQLPENFSIRFFNMTDIILENFSEIILKNFKYWSIEMYYRIFIPIIMQDYDRVLYLDSDIIVNTDLSKFYHQNFETNELIAIKDTTSQLLHLEEYQERKKHLVEILKLIDETKYFNSGVLLFNIKQINSLKYLQEFIKYIQIENLLFPDQDILNMLFQNKTKLISSKWNYCCGELIYNESFLDQIRNGYKKEFEEAKKNPLIIHYTSPKKPWNTKLHEHFEKFWEYARKTPFYEEVLSSMTTTLIDNSLKDSTRKLNLCLKLQDKKKYLFWGASLFLEDFINQYNINNDNILGIIDKNSCKQGKQINNYKIFAPEDIKILNPDEIIVTIINSQEERCAEIKEFLHSNKLQNIALTTL